MRVARGFLQTLVLVFLISPVLSYAGAGLENDEGFRRPTGIGKKSKLPMIVFLHQAGGCPAYLDPAFRRLVDQWRVCIYLPRGGTKLKVDKNGFQTYDWRTKDAVHLVAKIRKLIKDENIDPSLIFISGFSAGASMSYLVGMEAPDICAGVIPYSGTFPRKFINDEKFKAAKGKYPTYVVHGNADKTIPVKKVRAECVLLNKQGYNTELHLTDSGHDFPEDWADILSGAMEWCNER